MTFIMINLMINMTFPSSHTSNILISSISLLIYSGFRLGRTYTSNLHVGAPSESR